MDLPKSPNSEILPESPGLTPSDSPRGGFPLGRLARAFFGGLLFAVVLTLIGRGVMIFFIDPVPLTPSLILLELGHVAGLRRCALRRPAWRGGMTIWRWTPVSRRARTRAVGRENC